MVFPWGIIWTYIIDYLSFYGETFLSLFLIFLNCFSLMFSFIFHIQTFFQLFCGKDWDSLNTEYSHWRWSQEYIPESLLAKTLIIRKLFGARSRPYVGKIGLVTVVWNNTKREPALGAKNKMEGCWFWWWYKRRRWRWRRRSPEARRGYSAAC